jgi:hypothetical protein
VLFDGEVSGDESYGYEITATISDDFGAGIFKVSAPSEAPFGHLNLLVLCPRNTLTQTVDLLED